MRNNNLLFCSSSALEIRTLIDDGIPVSYEEGITHDNKKDKRVCK